MIPDDRASEIKGTITLADGTVSEFRIGTDGVWSQWDATRERLGRSTDVLDAMVAGLTEEGLLTSSNDPETEEK